MMTLQDIVLSEGHQSDKTNTTISHFLEKYTVIKFIKIEQQMVLG